MRVCGWGRHDARDGRAAEPTSRDESPYTVVAQLGRVLVEVKNSYVEPVDRAKLVNGAIRGMVVELDPHSSYMPPSDFSLFQSETEGKFVAWVSRSMRAAMRSRSWRRWKVRPWNARD